MGKLFAFTLKKRKLSAGPLLIVCAFLFFGVRLLSFQGIPDDQLPFPIDAQIIIEDTFADTPLVRQVQASRSLPSQGIKSNSSATVAGTPPSILTEGGPVSNLTHGVSVSNQPLRPDGAGKNSAAAGVHPAWGDEEAAEQPAASILTTKIDSPDEIVIGVLSCDKYLNTRATWVKKTWARRFHDVVYYSDTQHDSFPAVGVSHLPEEKFKKTGAWKDIPMLKHLFAKFPHKRWFFIVDDDTYILTHNFMETVRKLDASKEWYVGQCNWDNKQRNVLFVQGGGGILMSQPLVARVYPTLNECEKKYVGVYAGDIRIGFCMKDIGVKRPTYDNHFSGDSVGIILGKPGSNAEKRPDNRPVTFSHMDEAGMLQMEAMLYNNPHGYITYNMLKKVFPAIIKLKPPVPGTPPAAPPPVKPPVVPAGQAPPAHPPPPAPNPGGPPAASIPVSPTNPAPQGQPNPALLANAAAKPAAAGVSPHEAAQAPSPPKSPPAAVAGHAPPPALPKAAAAPASAPASKPVNPKLQRLLLSPPQRHSDPDHVVTDQHGGPQLSPSGFSGSAMIGSTTSRGSESEVDSSSDRTPHGSASDPESTTTSASTSGATRISPLHPRTTRALT